MTLTKPRLVSAFFASTCLSSLALSLPVQAATFSSVQSGIQFSNFSHPALGTEITTFTDTLAISSGGSIVAVSDAEAVFISGLKPGTETEALNLITSSAAGSGGNYFGLAQSEASLVGNFYLADKQTFYFSFSGFLTLDTAVDNATYESAFARGELGFALFGSTESKPATLLDSFNLFATLETPGDNDILRLLLTGNPGIQTIEQVFRQTGDLDEAFELKFSGRYSRTFDQPTLVSLVETKAGGAAVQQVPAPSLLWGLMAYGGLGVFGKLRRRLISVYAMVTDSDKYTS